MNPIFDLITSPVAASGLISKARAIATEHGGNFRAPHHTVSRAAIGAEMAIAAGGVLLLDEPAEFSRLVVNMIAHTWAAMDPACRPRIMLIVCGPYQRLSDNLAPKATTSTLARIVDLFAGWTIAEHHTA